jgi:hypothetical protein
MLFAVIPLCIGKFISNIEMQAVFFFTLQDEQMFVIQYQIGSHVKAGQYINGFFEFKGAGSLSLKSTCRRSPSQIDRNQRQSVGQMQLFRNCASAASQAASQKRELTPALEPCEVNCCLGEAYYWPLEY